MTCEIIQPFFFGGILRESEDVEFTGHGAPWVWQRLTIHEVARVNVEVEPPEKWAYEPH